MRTTTYNAIKTLLRMDTTVSPQLRMSVIAAMNGTPRFDPTEDMSLANAAEYLGLNRITLWRMCKANAIAHDRRGKKFYIKASAIAALKKENAE